MRLRLGFRARLLLALLGTLLPLLSVTLLVVQLQTQQQVRAFIDAAVARSRTTFSEVEQINRQRLTALGQRFAFSSRTAALLQAALFEEPDPEFTAGQIGYELGLAGEDSALVALTDLNGTALGAVLDAGLLPEHGQAVPNTLLEQVLARGDTVAFGYHLIGHRLYSVYLSLLRVVEEPMGFVVVGLPITDQTAATIGSAVGAQVCFVANRECVAATPGLAGSALSRADLVAAAGEAEPRYTTRDGSQWVLIADRGLASDTSIASVMALLLDSVLKPFRTIRYALYATGAATLALALLLSLVLSRGLARPVRALVAATSRVARGEYDVHVDVRGSDEIATLAGAFNEMTHGLLLKERYRGLLDKVVSAEVAEEMLSGEITLGGENREVTTVFADVRGFTAFTEGMEPQAVIGILNEVMQRASTAIEAEGGVVDKYIGDEVMGVFGAPVSRPDDAARGVRAALRIRDQVAELSRERTSRGDRPLAIGIGINTGLVVAGNMGSQERLNYTVLGESVNIAARLCTQAGPQEILLAEQTYLRVRELVEALPAGERLLRGLSQPVTTYALQRLRGTAPAASLLLLALLLPAQLFAQQPLLSVSSRSGALQASLGARVAATGYVPQERAPYLVEGHRAFIAPRVSLFAEAFAGQHLMLAGELRADRGEAPADRPLQVRVQQLYLRAFPLRTLDLNVQVGKFVSPFGNYPQRHHSAADPLIRPPLPYEHRTMMTPGFVAARNDGFLEWKDRPEFFRPLGVPVIWGAPYQVGAMLFGTAGRAAWRLAAMNSAPSSDPPEWDRIAELWERPSFVAHASYAVLPDLRLGLSYNVGPYMLEEHAGAPYPAGMEASDYGQEIWGAEATYARGRVAAHAELFRDGWDVPNTRDDAYDTSWYVETRVKLAVGWFVAGRYGAIHFHDMRRDDDTSVPWDYDIRRLQLGGGYRFSRALELRLEYLINDSDGALDPRDNLFSVQLSFER